MASYALRLKGSGILRFAVQSSRRFGGARMLSAAMSSSSRSNVINTSPWLMLPPKAGDDMVYKFYNLSEDRVESFGVKLPDKDDAVLVGSSHGWLAYFNHCNNQVFLTNPLSGRQLKLPPIDTLPNPEMNLRNGCGTVSKLILSCSPDDEEQECRAMISFGPGDRLAFCLPGRSDHWTPIGDLFFEKFPADNKNPPTLLLGRAYEDFVYCSRRKLFTCITEFTIDLEGWGPYSPTELEDWDLGGGDHTSPPRSRVCYWLDLLKFEEAAECEWFQQYYKFLLAYCTQIPYLVYSEHNKQLYILSRFIEDHDFKPTPMKTFGFAVLKVGYVGNGVVVDSLRLADSLDGLAMFVGMNHSFAVPADEFGLKPNSIYYTDANTRLTNPSDVRSPYHHEDIDMGIFDYENKTLSPCCPFYDASLLPYSLGPCPQYVFSSQNLATPVWFTPSL